MGSYIDFENVNKRYRMGDHVIEAVNGASFCIEKGEFCVVVGPSGAGKTTILNLLSGMDAVSDGTITVDGVRVSEFSERKLTLYRRYDVGFVFQFYNLIQNLTAFENVELSSQIAMTGTDSRVMLRDVGLDGRLNNFPSQLSGGEQQRVAIARAMAKKPKLLLCDEPIGALDYATGRQILRLLHSTCRQNGMTVVVVTHNMPLTAIADRVIKVRNGSVSEVSVNRAPLPVEEVEW